MRRLAASGRCGSRFPNVKHFVRPEDRLLAASWHERPEDATWGLCRGITWMTKDGLRKPNYWGSITQAATCRVGNYKGEEVHAPFSSLLPMVHPNDLVLGGWDISNLNLADAMERAKVRAPALVMCRPLADSRPHFASAAVACTHPTWHRECDYCVSVTIRLLSMHSALRPTMSRLSMLSGHSVALRRACCRDAPPGPRQCMTLLHAAHGTPHAIMDGLRCR